MPATSLATKIDFNQNGIYDQFDHENHEYISSALNRDLQGQNQGQRTGTVNGSLDIVWFLEFGHQNEARQKF